MEVRLAAHVKDWTSEEVFAANKAVQALAEHPGWKVVLDLVEAERQKLLRDLTNEQLYEHVEYARKTGRIAGLGLFEGVPETVAEVARRTERSIEQLAAREAEEA